MSAQVEAVDVVENVETLETQIVGHADDVGDSEDAHARGECRPCAYFWHKVDGCRWGDECEFCHLCDRDALKRLKKAKRRRMKAKGKACEEGDEDVGQHDEESSKSQPLETWPRSQATLKLGEPAHINISPPPGLSRVARPYLPMQLFLELHSDNECKANSVPADDGEQGIGLPDKVLTTTSWPELDQLTVGTGAVDELDSEGPAKFLSVEDMFPELRLRSSAPTFSPMEELQLHPPLHGWQQFPSHAPAAALASEFGPGVAPLHYRTPLRASANSWRP